MDWYDGKENATLSEAFSSAPKMPNKPTKPKWDNNFYIYSDSELGAIFELTTEADRMMHTHTAGQCFVWNYINQPREEGFRLFTYRSPDGWGRVSIQCRTLDTLIAGTGSRMYSGKWREKVAEREVRLLHGENLVLLDYDGSYVYGGGDTTQAQVDAMKADVMKWWSGLPIIVAPEPTEAELARKIEYR